MANIVGLSAYFHDSACCLMQKGVVTAAVQEERLSRQKHDPSLPCRSFRYCLDHAGLSCADIDALAYYENPVTKLHRQLSQFSAGLTEEDLLNYWLGARRPAAGIRDALGYEREIVFVDHHEAHAGSAYYFSPFDEAAVLTVDAVGEWATTTFGHGAGRTMQLVDEVRFPHSLGLFYSTLTSYLGFAVSDGEYKVMGLAPYGRPRFLRQMRQMISTLPSGGFALNLEYFDFTRSDRMHSDALAELLGVPPRRPADPMTSDHHDIASSAQVRLEEVLMEEVRRLHDRVPVDNLCMAGGVALNCVANGRIRRDGPFKRVFVQPAAGDAGGALGAAALAHVRASGAEAIARCEHVYLGPEYTSHDVMDAWRGAVTGWTDYRNRPSDQLIDVAERLAAGHVIGWCDGRLEFGPRALGARSILADPRDPTMRDRINRVVKRREGFRPFAPAVLEAEAATHFDLDWPSPFMTETCQTRSAIPLSAVTHVDGSARVQTVNTSGGGRFAPLLEAFRARTGCPILLNTSFNISDEPIVCTPVDALITFARSELDTLVFGDLLLDRSDLKQTLVEACRRLDGRSSDDVNYSVYQFA